MFIEGYRENISGTTPVNCILERDFFQYNISDNLSNKVLKGALFSFRFIWNWNKKRYAF